MIAVGYTMIYGVILLINSALLRCFFFVNGLLRDLRRVVGHRRLSPVETITPSGRADYGHRNVDLPSKPGHGHLGFPAQAIPPGSTPCLF